MPPFWAAEPDLMNYHLYLPDAAKPRHRQLKRLMLAVRDFEMAAGALEAAKALPHKDHNRSALISAAVMSYARPFSSGRNWTAISSKWARFSDLELSDIHRFICDWRNSVVAHNDEELNDVEFLPKGSIIAFRPDGKAVPIRLTTSSHGEFFRTPEYPANMVEPFLRLCRFQHHRMGEATAKEKDALFDEFLRPEKKPQ